jgi:hypothetical protein
MPGASFMVGRMVVQNRFLTFCAAMQTFCLHVPAKLVFPFCVDMLSFDGRPSMRLSPELER